MDTIEWQQIETYFHKALELPVSQRNAFIGEQFANQPQVRDAILRMLEHAENTASLNAIVEQAASSVVDSSVDLTGTMAGNYQLIRKIDSGGMGAVYLAERADQQFQKQVAVKLINTAVREPYLAARFIEERQTLANLEHANITRLYDGGSTDNDIPFLVMEYVDGTPLDRYCEERQLTLRARLQLFLKVCDALQYAHQKLVIHCDLKPANILVDAAGEPKLMDFGIARLIDKAVSNDDASKSMTLSYASPEQLAGKPVSVATDVFALGLILQKLVSEGLPIETVHSSSARLEQLERLAPIEVASSAGYPRGRVLDAIIYHAVQFKPQDRYSSVSDMRKDIDNYLHHYPVTAFAPGPWYRCGLYLQRNMISAALTCSLVVVMLVTSVTIWQQSNAVAQQKEVAERERDSAQLAQQKAESVSEFITDMFYELKPDNAKGSEVTVMEVIEKTIDRLNDDDQAGLVEQPLVNAEIRLTIGNMLWQIGNIKQSIVQLETAVALYEQHSGQDTKAYLTTLNALANAYSRADRHPERLPIAEKIVNAAREVHGENARRTLGYTLNLGGYYNDMEQPEKAIDIHLDVLERAVQHLGEDNDVTIITLASLGNDYYRYGDEEQAISYFNRALEDATRAFGEQHTLVLYSMERLVSIYSGGLTTDKAGEEMAIRYLDLSTRMLGERHQDTLRAKYLLARILYQKHQYDASLVMIEEAIPVLTEVLGPKHYRVIDLHSLRATVLMEGGQLEQALVASQQVLAAKTERYGKIDDYTIREQHKLGDIYLRLRQLGKAELSFKEALQRWQELPVNNPNDYENRFIGEHEALLALAAVYHLKQQPDKQAEMIARATRIENEQSQYSYREHDVYFPDQVKEPL